MKHLISILFLVTLTWNSFAQSWEKKYVSEDGKTYSRSQIDSLISHGNFVGFVEGKRNGDNIVYQIYFYEKSKFHEEGFYCGNDKNRLTVSEIKKQFPYNVSQRIEVVSFKPDSTRRFQIPKKNGQVDRSRLFETKVLDESLTSQLLDVLANFSYNPDYASKVESEIYFCYDPRNAILFVDKQENIVGYVEICFHCFGIRIEPENLMNGHLFCHEKFEIIKELFRNAGVLYGTGLTEQPASFPGGLKAQLSFIKDNLKSAPGTLEYEGGVIVEFQINEDGSLSDITIRKSLCEACDKNAIELIKTMPKWIPAISPDGKPVKSSWILPVRYPPASNFQE